jgi:hypothetical protein
VWLCGCVAGWLGGCAPLCGCVCVSGSDFSELVAPTYAIFSRMCDRMFGDGCDCVVHIVLG